MTKEKGFVPLTLKVIVVSLLLTAFVNDQGKSLMSLTRKGNVTNPFSLSLAAAIQE
jgi:hypothetical protein